jgi:dipeptidase E
VFVRMYLSSFRLGNDPRTFLDLLGDRTQVLVVANGLDAEDPETTTDRLREELHGLRQLGVAADELDLREFLADTDGLRQRLEECGGVWLRGGNLFLVRALLARTGGDQIINELVRTDRLVLAGYSVAPAIVGPSLRGFELVDDPTVATRDVGVEPVWEGLGLLPQVVVPHCDSPEHPASAVLSRLADDLADGGVAVARLRDGEALVIDGPARFIA